MSKDSKQARQSLDMEWPAAIRDSNIFSTISSFSLYIAVAGSQYIGPIPSEMEIYFLQYLKQKRRSLM
jgi:hypothetical protein